MSTGNLNTLYICIDAAHLRPVLGAALLEWRGIYVKTERDEKVICDKVFCW